MDRKNPSLRFASKAPFFVLFSDVAFFYICIYLPPPRISTGTFHFVAGFLWVGVAEFGTCKALGPTDVSSPSGVVCPGLL